MRKLKYLVMISSLIFLSACGKKEVDYNVTDTGTGTENQQSDALQGSIKEKIGAPDEWVEDIDTDKMKRINAEIIIPDVSGMNVYDVKDIDYKNSPEKKEEFIGKLSEGEVYYYGEGYETKDYYKEAMDELLYQMKILEVNGLSDQDSKTSYDICLSSYNDLEELYNNAPEEPVKASNYEASEYLFTYNNIDYIVRFGEDSLFMQPKNVGEVISEEDAEFLYGELITDEPNRCGISEDEGEDIALEFINHMEFGDFCKTDTYDMTFDVYEERNGIPGYHADTYNNGYVYTFVRKVDDMLLSDYIYENSNMMYSEISELMGEEHTNHSSYSYVKNNKLEIIKIGVNDKGVVLVEYDGPTQITGTKAENVKLLSFDNVLSAFSYEIDARPIYEKVTFRYMELCYMSFTDDNGTRCIIPVWRLTDVSADSIIGGEDFSYVVINAMDGTVINVADNLFDVEFY